MKKILVGLLAVGVLLAGSVGPSYAGGGWHRPGGWHGGWHGGWRGPVFVGPRFVVARPYFVAPPVYYYPRPYVYAVPPVVASAVAAAPATVYIQSQSVQYWYYCQDPAGYYPSVPECPGGWTPVAPQPQ